jgi:threonine dehydratase
MQVELTTENRQDFITIKIPVSKRPSASGKTTVVASSNGNHATSVIIDGKPLVVGLNAYIPK